MRFSVPLFVVASAISAADAFIPTAFRQRAMPPMTPSAQQMAAEKTDPPTNVIQDVHLPDGMVPETIENSYVNDLITKVFAPSLLMNANGYLKSNPLQSKKGPLTVVQEIMINVNEYKVGFRELEKKFPKLQLDQYKFFGNGNHVQSLAELLKTNPFWTSALVPSADGGFELNAYNPAGPETRYQHITATLTNPGRKVNVKFDQRMDFVSYEVFDDSETGIMLASGDATSDDADKWASSAMYNMLFYASCQHATIHVFHYLLTSAFQYVANEHDKKSEETSGMKAWADTYANNIQTKYEQVGQLLITNTPPIPATANLFLENTEKLVKATGGIMGATYAIITGAMGFGSSQAIRPLLNEMLTGWGENPTAEGWMKFMFPDLKRTSEGYVNPHKDGGVVLLEEFSKQYDIIPEFAKDMDHVLKTEPHALEAEIKLCEYLNDLCGNFRGEFKGFDNWIEVMAVTGLVHGCTLSYTRTFADWEVLRWRNIEDPYWDTGDISMLFSGMGTIVGMQLERHVFGGGSFLPKGRNESVKKVLNKLAKFDEKSTDIKNKYAAKLLETPGFLEYGWIWTDFAVDGFDGKQLTMATYI